MTDATNRPAGPHRTRLEEAIDRAVHDIVHREPPPGLRRRVMARLEAPRPPARFLPRLAFVAAAAVVVAGVTMAVFRTNGPDATTPPARVAAAQPAAIERPPLPPAPESAAAPPSPVSAGRPPAARRAPERRPIVDPSQLTRIFGERQGRVGAASLPEGPRALPAGDAVPVPPAAVGLPALPDIQIAPIRIEPIPVPPITIR
jgi:hypothetical protein